jgi:hypothetical protein
MFSPYLEALFRESDSAASPRDVAMQSVLPQKMIQVGLIVKIPAVYTEHAAGDQQDEFAVPGVMA